MMLNPIMYLLGQLDGVDLTKDLNFLVQVMILAVLVLFMKQNW